MITIEKLIPLTQLKSIVGTLHHQVTHITLDSRQVIEGSMFCAIEGHETDGHLYIEDAIKRGAKVILYSNILRDYDYTVTYIQVNDIREVMARVSDALYNHPSKKLHVIGVTGTNGKTSITQLIKRIYHYNRIKAGTIGTLGATFHHYNIDLVNTTPESPYLHQLLSSMVTQDITNAVMEVSSHGLELKRVSHIDFDIGIFTNLTPDHLNFHGTMEAYYRAKRKLFFMTKQNNIINIDDPYGLRLYNELKSEGYPVVSYGIEKSADYSASIIDTEVSGTRFLFKYQNICHEILSNTPGLFSVYNYLAAIAATHMAEIPMLDILQSLENYTGAPGRMERLTHKHDFNVILDFAHTPDGLENVLKTLSEFTKGRIILVFGAGGDRDYSRRLPMGQVAAQYADHCIITMDNPRFEDPMSISLEIAEGMMGSKCKHHIVLEREKAVHTAIKMAKNSDTVLLAGKAYEMYQIIKDKKVHYDERSIAINAINSLISS